jgi:hypothetical protein
LWYCSRVSLASNAAVFLPLPRGLFLSLSVSHFFPCLVRSSAVVPCICRRLGQCGWRRPFCGRWRRARRLGHIRCAGPVASVSAAWAGRHRRRQGASQAWPASSRDATAQGGGGDNSSYSGSRMVSVSTGRRTAGLGWQVPSQLRASSKPGGRKNPEYRSEGGTASTGGG